jgi:mannose-6-phosphate isomerase class I
MPLNNIPDYDPSDMINRPDLAPEWRDRLVVGLKSVLDSIADLVENSLRTRRHGLCRIAIESHHGVPWDRWVKELRVILEKRDIHPEFLDSRDYFRPPASIQKMVQPCLPDDPVFGRVFKGDLNDFFDKRKLARINKKIRVFALPATQRTATDTLVCFGCGAAKLGPKSCFDYILYIDLCREEILKRLKSGYVTPLGAKKPAHAAAPGASALPAYFGARQLYYVDYPVLDKHRKWVLQNLAYYIDGNELGNPKLMPSSVFSGLLERVISAPIKPKPYYDPGPWGGQWLKKVRKLPKEMVNCAWSYDLIEPEASFQVQWDKTVLEFPFQVLTLERPRDILGVKANKFPFRAQFPIRINYDDSYRGGDMALQCHPTDIYIKREFNERFRQDESYYIVDSRPGSKVHLGLREEAGLEDFRDAVTRAEKEGVPFDHKQFVNALPSEPGDLFLIPAGTLHGSGVDETVLEISATTYRYTFHFYDFLRPGLDGKLRPIHLEHAFAALKPGRRTKWVKERYIQKPRRLRRGKGWSEDLIGALPDLFFKIHRLEFEREILDDTEGDFHLLVLVEGNRIRIEALEGPERGTELPFSCVALAPATLGPYRIRSVDGTPCKVVKVLMA